jgi:hypothetical protein
MSFYRLKYLIEFIGDFKGIGPLRENENSKVLRNVS